MTRGSLLIVALLCVPPVATGQTGAAGQPPSTHVQSPTQSQPAGSRCRTRAGHRLLHPPRACRGDNHRTSHSRRRGALTQLGRFRLNTLAPGDYFAVALEYVDPNEAEVRTLDLKIIIP